MRLVDRSDPSAPADTMRLPALWDRICRSPCRTWISLAPVVAAALALAMLAVFPWIANVRLASVRLDSAETLVPARQFVRDIGAALVLEVATRDELVRRNTPELVRRQREAVAMERACDSALGALAPRLGGNLAGDIAQLRSLTAQWNAERTGSAAGAGANLTDVLAATARLDSAIARRQAQQSAHIRSLEALDVLLPTILVPVLAVVLLALYWTGRRMTTLANEAGQSRHALAVASEQKVTLLRGLTHDLKNALGAARGYAMLLREEVAGPLTTQQRDQVARIGRIIDQTIVAVEDALMIARTEAGALPVRRTKEDLRALVLESASDYVPAAERAGLTLTVDFAQDLPPVDTDPSLVSKIIGNLLSNAIKYTPTGGRIWLRAFARPGRETPEAGPWVVVEVCDTGPGVPAALREQVFDEFFRAPTATTTARGEGIGLAMSRRVARLLGGEITLKSEEGRGAVFTLWLPAPSPDTESPQLPPPPEGRPPGTDGQAATDEDVEIMHEGRPAGTQPRSRASGTYDRRRAV